MPPLRSNPQLPCLGLTLVWLIGEFDFDDLYNAPIAFDNGVQGTAELGRRAPVTAVAARQQSQEQ
jgi:hypothetical protein